MANPVGRPSKLTEDFLKDLENLLERQSSVLLTDEEMLEHIGIDNQTKQNWLNPEYKGADEELKKKFFELIKRGRRFHKMNLGDKLAIGENGWQGSAWMLERKFSDLNLRNISEVKQENTGKVEIVWGKSKED